MMEKTVYCIIGERCKCLKCTLDKNMTDAEMIRSRLKQACLTDSLLDRKMKNHDIFLHIRDAGRNDQFRELEKDKVIANSIDVNVVLIRPSTVDLRKTVSKTEITAANRHKFIAFWGEYLYNETDGTPSKDQYGNLASDSVAEYLELSAGPSGNGLVRTQLSSWIRNHRRNLKAPESRKSTKRDQVGNPKPKPPSELAVALPSPSYG
ncbi:uncharacterized protein [Chelonus insularis]|uniref:uncharacterized protein n=1 Tax=Chelonus insularis TaxID=460826 RepID=UPI00158D483F|nr:uncharacterized protein LOC118064904 [Chelonus insularis]